MRVESVNFVGLRGHEDGVVILETHLTVHPDGEGFGQAGVVNVEEGVRAEMLGHTDARDAWVRELVTFFDHVNTEDRQVVEGIYAGSRSGFAAPGQLSWLEREIHDFQKYLARRLVHDRQEGHR